MAAPRSESLDSALEMYEHTLPNRDMINGVGLDGVSDGGAMMGFSPFYTRAKADGFGTTGHVDSEMHFVRTQLLKCITELGGRGIDQLDHGTSAAEWPELLAMIKEKGIGITSCPCVFCGVFAGKKT